MIIRSQDKTMIVNLNNIDCIYSNRENKIIVFNGEAQSHIGKYSTEEKAIKVLDMIQDKYLSRMELDGGYDMMSGCYVQHNYWVLPKVFQMPQDSEV